MISNFHVIFSNLKVAFHDNSNFPYLKCFFIELGILDWHGHWLGPRLTRVTMLNVLQIWKIIFSIVPLRRNINTHFVFIFDHARSTVLKVQTKLNYEQSKTFLLTKVVHCLLHIEDRYLAENGVVFYELFVCCLLRGWVYVFLFANTSCSRI